MTLPASLPALASAACLAFSAPAVSADGAVATGPAAQAPRDTNVSLADPKPFKAICYGGYRPGQGPGWAEPSEQEVREDLRILAAYAHEIRTYGSGAGTHGHASVPKICDELGLKLHLGIWVDDTYEEAVNLKAVDDAIAVAKRGHASLKSVIVGNEYMFRVRSGGRPAAAAEARLRAYIQRVKAGIPAHVQVTTADTWGDWMQNSDSLIAAIDYLLWHTHPWWEKKPLEGIAAHMGDVHARIKSRLAARFPGKRELLGEVGWPSLIDNPPAVGSEANQFRFFQALHAWAWNQHLEYWSFSAFDEAWKAGGNGAPGEGPVGGHWGLWKEDRAPKNVIVDAASLMPPYMRWDADPAVSLAHGPRMIRPAAGRPVAGLLGTDGRGRIGPWATPAGLAGQGARDAAGRISRRSFAWRFAGIPADQPAVSR